MAEPVSVRKVKRSLGIITPRGVDRRHNTECKEEEKTKNMKDGPGIASKGLAGLCLHCFAFGALAYMQESRGLAGKTYQSRAGLIAMMHLTF